jgi:hypothetical protein
MSEINKLVQRVEQIEAKIGQILKTVIPIQEVLRPEVALFEGHATASAIDSQPQELFNVAVNYWFFVRSIIAEATPDDDSSPVLSDLGKIRFNLQDTGRGYNVFNQPLPISLFMTSNGLNNKLSGEEFSGLLIKEGANVRANLNLVGTNTKGYNIRIYVIGDYIAPSYISYYFHKVRKM